MMNDFKAYKALKLKINKFDHHQGQLIEVNKKLINNSIKLDKRIEEFETIQRIIGRPQIILTIHSLFNKNYHGLNLDKKFRAAKEALQRCRQYSKELFERKQLLLSQLEELSTIKKKYELFLLKSIKSIDPVLYLEFKKVTNNKVLVDMAVLSGKEIIKKLESITDRIWEDREKQFLSMVGAGILALGFRGRKGPSLAVELEALEELFSEYGAYLNQLNVIFELPHNSHYENVTDWKDHILGGMIFETMTLHKIENRLDQFHSIQKRVIVMQKSLENLMPEISEEIDRLEQEIVDQLNFD